MKINFNTIYTDTSFGYVQESVKKIVANILLQVANGEVSLDDAIYRSDCSLLDSYSEETPVALPLGEAGTGHTIGLTIQGNKLVDDDTELTGNRYETFNLITVEVADFKAIAIAEEVSDK